MRMFKGSRPALNELSVKFFLMGPDIDICGYGNGGLSIKDI